MKVYISKIEGQNGVIPTKAHPTDAGWDLYTSREELLTPGAHADIHTDICVAMPDGNFGLIIARSSTLPKWDLIVLPGIIDAGYRGELFIQVFNRGGFQGIPIGSRIAQLLLLPVPSVEFEWVDHLPSSPRGERGFGHSGV